MQRLLIPAQMSCHMIKGTVDQQLHVLKHKGSTVNEVLPATQIQVTLA